MSLVLSICELFISLMQLVNGAQFLNTTCLLLLFASSPVATLFTTDIVPLTSIYDPLNSHNFYFNVEVLNWM